MAPDDRLEDLGALAGVQHVRRRLHRLLDLGGIGDVDHRRRARQPDREALAVLRAAALDERDRPRPPRERLERRRAISDLEAASTRESYGCHVTGCVTWFTSHMTAAVAAPPLTRRSAVALAAAIRTGETTSREVVEEHIEVLRAAQPRTRAIAKDRFERALREAEEADAATQPRGPLHGVPCTVKESIASQGCRTARGSSPAATTCADRDAPAVARVRAAGAIPVGRHEHVRDDDVDRVAQPPLRPLEQRVRPAAHRGRLVGRRGRRGRQRRSPVRARRRHRRLDPPARVLQRRLRPHAVERPRPEHGPVPGRRRRGRADAARSGRSRGAPPTSCHSCA